MKVYIETTQHKTSVILDGIALNFRELKTALHYCRIMKFQPVFIL